MNDLDLQARIAVEVRRFKAKWEGADGSSVIKLNDNLLNALESAKDSRALILDAQHQVSALLANATSEIERNARLYQIDLVEWQINRAADYAEKRLNYLTKIKTDFDVKTELAKCAADQIHWFEMYAWGIDPRPDAPLSLMPFGLFPFQERYVEWLDYITFTQRKSGITEKARDMGATETFLRWMWHKWRFRDGFIGMVLSANEDLVDLKKDPSTLFEKIRFQTRLVPNWMLPKTFNVDRDMPYMLMQNPENDSIILGDAPTANVGRQRRATVVLGDEYAAWAHGGYPQYTALSRTTNSFCPVSSVQGKFNKFADLAHDNLTAKFEMNWYDHPWRDQRWYDALKFGYIGSAMTDEEIAQEVDRNYEASQPGRVLKNVREEYCFITWDEMVAGFGRVGTDITQFYGSNLTPVIPPLWNWGRVTDYGESARTENDTHIWAYSLFARPQQAYPFNDSLFFFHSRPIEPIGAAELEAYKYYAELEENIGVRKGRELIRRPSVNDMSHEATDAKEVLRKQCGDSWNIPDLNFDKGRRKLVFHFEIIDKHLPNPFRPVLSGRTRIYFVSLPTPDGQPEYFLAKDERKGTYFVTPSQTQGGFKRLRAEIGAWHYPPEERGKPIQKMRPKDVFDDIITTVRYAVARWGVDSAPLTKQQQVEGQLSPEVRADHIQTLDPTMQERLIGQRMIELGRIREKENKQSANAAKFRPTVPKIRMPSGMRRR
jgi:hypothetical protein